MRFAVPAAAGFVLLLLAGCPAKDDAAGGGPGVGPGGGSAPSGPPPVSVLVAAVEQREYSPALELTGEIRASQRATLTAEVGGRITAISARVGDSHRRNAGALIQINPADYQAQVNAAQSALDQANAALAEAKAGPRPQDIAAQQALVAQAESVVAEARDNLARQQQLYDSNVVSENVLVAARTRLESAEAALEAQLQALSRLNEGTRKEQLDAAAARVKAAQSALELAQLSLGKASVNTAFDAKVSALMVEVGQSVNPGTPLVEVIADAPGEAWFNLPESEVGRVRTGDSVEVRSDAFPDEVFTGKVLSISSAADQTTRQFPLRAEISDKRLLPGMAVRGRILLGQPQPVLMASQDATYESKLGLVVYRVTAASSAEELPSFETVDVKTGERLDGMVVITESSLRPGDMLVTRGKEGLYPGARLNITNPGSAPPAATDEADTGESASEAEAADSAGEAPAAGQGN